VAGIRELRFGRFRLHPAQGLSRGHKLIHVTPKSLALLNALVTRAGEVVTKDELMQEVWPGVVVTDASLATCIQELRAALKDQARKPRFIETVHRRGYRFIGVADGPAEGAPVSIAPPAAAGAIVGRSAALEQLATAFAQAQRGRRQLLFVSGEPGIGKTAVAETFVAGVASRTDVLVARGDCMEHYGAGEAYQPLLDALARLGRDAGKEHLVSTLRKCAPTWLAQLPSLQTVAEFRTLQQRTAGATRERMLRELTDAFEAMTGRAPLVLHLEDIHWSDVSTLDWLSAFARRSEPARALIVATFRSADTHANTAALRALIDDLRLKGLCREIALGGLDAAAVLEYVSAHYPAAPTGRARIESLAHLVQKHTDGNPLFMVNVLRDLESRGLLTERQGLWSTQSDIDGALLRIPEDIRRTIEQRLDRLGSRERNLLTVASACGGTCPAVAVAAGAGVEVSEAERVLTDLARQRSFLKETGSVRWPDGTISASFEFLHALYREVLADRMKPARSAEVHRLIGTRLEAAYGERAREIAPELAMHFDHACDAGKAITYLQHAATIDQLRNAHREAHAHLRRALELLDTQPPSRERDEREVALRIALGSVLVATHGFGAPEVEGAYSRARALCRGLGGTARSFPALWGLWVYYLDRGPLDTCREIADSLSGLAHESNESDLVLQAHHAQWATMFSAGDMAATEDYARKGIALYDGSRHAAHASTYGAHDACVCAWNFAARAAVLTGRAETAVRSSDEAIAHARELGHPFTLALALVFAAFVHQARRDVDGAFRRAVEAGAISREHGFVLMHGWADVIEGWAAAERGEGERGIALMRAGIDRSGSKGSSLFLPQMLGVLGQTELTCERVGEARATLQRALTQVARTGDQVSLADLHGLAGDLCLADGTDRANRLRAEDHFRAGLERARSQGARLLELRAAVKLARSWVARGQPAEARTLLKDAATNMPEAAGSADVLAARALLAEC
jgi:DNA-binding winged helix-turn-helix (wHTH) protein/tetratricopeptide (TPR) repeat protein